MTRIGKVTIYQQDFDGGRWRAQWVTENGEQSMAYFKLTGIRLGGRLVYDRVEAFGA